MNPLLSLEISAFESLLPLRIHNEVLWWGEGGYFWNHTIFFFYFNLFRHCFQVSATEILGSRGFPTFEVSFDCTINGLSKVNKSDLQPDELTCTAFNFLLVSSICVFPFCLPCGRLGGERVICG